MLIDRRGFIKSSSAAAFATMLPFDFSEAAKQPQLTGKPIECNKHGELIFEVLPFVAHVHTKLSCVSSWINADHRLSPDLDQLHSDCLRAKVGVWISDHAEVISNSDWRHIHELCADLNRQGCFSMPGFEWTKGGSLFPEYLKEYCHVGVYGTKEYAGTRRILSDSGCQVVKDYLNLLLWILRHKVSSGRGVVNSFASFNHPWDFYSEEKGFMDYIAPGDKGLLGTMNLIEVMSQTTKKIGVGLEYCLRALARGWNVTPIFGADNFAKLKLNRCCNGAVLMYKAPKDDLAAKGMYAVQRQAVFASETPNLNFYYYFESYNGDRIYGGSEYDVDKLGPPRCFNIVMDGYTESIYHNWDVYFIYNAPRFGMAARRIEGDFLGAGEPDMRNAMRWFQRLRPHRAVIRLVTRFGSAVYSPLIFRYGSLKK